MVRTKVFVGNLSFTTKENELAKEFEVAGKVISANIITRGPRSLGYGFVEMDNEADAENAVKLLDKKEVDGRPINVEVAKPREEGAPDATNNNQQGGARGGRGGARGGSRGGRGGRGGARGGQGQSQGQQQGGQGQSQQQGQGQGQSQQGGNGFRRQFRRRDSDDEGEEGQQQGGARGGRGGRGGRGRGAPRAARPPRPEGEDTRTPSTTTLFVANLPFALEDDGFAKVLKDGSLAYKTAHVVKKKTGRSKGFGFIEFDTEGDQQKALAALNGKDLEGRALVVKVALTGQKVDETTATGAPQDAVTPTNKPSVVKAAVTGNTAPLAEVKKEEKPTTPKQEQKK